MHIKMQMKFTSQIVAFLKWILLKVKLSQVKMLKLRLLYLFLIMLRSWTSERVNPRTNKQIHTPTVVRGGGGVGGGAWMEPLPGVFDMLQYFETILPLVESL